MNKHSGTLYHRWTRVAMRVVMAFAVAFFVFLPCGLVYAGANGGAAGDRVIPRGIYIGPVDVGGMTADQAKTAVGAFLEDAGGVRLSLKDDEGEAQGVTPRAMGLSWKNPEIVQEAFNYGKRGNAVRRYKELKDLEHHMKHLDLEVTLDEKLVREWLEENAERYEQKAVNYELHRQNGAFVITNGNRGSELDKEESLKRIMSKVSEDWDFGPADIELAIVVQEPMGSKEELESVKDILGTYTTSYRSSGGARSANVENGCRLINDTTVYPGQEFSVLSAITPFTEGNGYQLAASYQNGQVVDSLGGGICQVSTTLYNAVLLAELAVKERHNHSMIVTYVSPSADAAIAESTNKDFKFVNDLDTPIYIEGITDSDKRITFNIYGKETRDPGHKVSFESETLEKIMPEGDVINANASLPAGEVQIQSAHIGYRAQLWKIVTENGVQVSRDVINSSNYKMVPRIATVGTATTDPAAENALNQAISSGSIDLVQQIASAIRAGAVSSPQPQPETQEGSVEPAPQPETEAAPVAEGAPAEE